MNNKMNRTRRYVLLRRMMAGKLLPSSLLAIMFTVLLSSCSKPGAPPADEAREREALSHSLHNLDSANQQFSYYLAEVSKNALSQGKALEEKIQQFLQQPKQELLTDTREDWEKLELTLQGLHPLIILNQIDPKGFFSTSQLIDRILAHPIQPGYLDRFGDYPYSGLVYAIGIPLTQSGLMEQHGLTDSQEVVFGIYTMEFMLYGEGNSRLADDYIQKTTLSKSDRELGLKNEDEIAENRRRQLLSLQLEQLMNDLGQLSSMLNMAGSLSTWKQQPPQQQLSAVRRGLSTGLTQILIELADFQTRYFNREERALPELQLPEQERSLKKLRQRLLSLSPWADYFSPLEQESIRSALRNAAETLQSPALTNNSDPVEAQKQLQNIYENIKTLM